MFLFIDTQPETILPIKEKRSARASSFEGGLPHVLSTGRYMSNGHLKHFKAVLSAEKESLLSHLQNTQLAEKDILSDPLDSASQASDHEAEAFGLNRAFLRLRDVDQALLRIEQGDFGFCEVTGDEIGLQRLIVNPVAKLTVEAQERQEKLSRNIRSPR